jgi:hypothetical protein
MNTDIRRRFRQTRFYRILMDVLAVVLVIIEVTDAMVFKTFLRSVSQPFHQR